MCYSCITIWVWFPKGIWYALERYVGPAKWGDETNPNTSPKMCLSLLSYLVLCFLLAHQRGTKDLKPLGFEFRGKVWFLYAYTLRRRYVVLEAIRFGGRVWFLYAFRPAFLWCCCHRLAAFFRAWWKLFRSTTKKHYFLEIESLQQLYS